MGRSANCDIKLYYIKAQARCAKDVEVGDADYIDTTESNVKIKGDEF